MNIKWSNKPKFWLKFSKLEKKITQVYWKYYKLAFDYQGKQAGGQDSFKSQPIKS